MTILSQTSAFLLLLYAQIWWIYSFLFHITAMHWWESLYAPNFYMPCELASWMPLPCLSCLLFYLRTSKSLSVGVWWTSYLYHICLEMHLIFWNTYTLNAYKFLQYAHLWTVSLVWDILAGFGRKGPFTHHQQAIEASVQPQHKSQYEFKFEFLTW